MRNFKVFYSGVSVLTFLYVCLFSGLYAEWALLDYFYVPADYSVIVETKVRLGIENDKLLTDEQVTELLSKKVSKQRNLAVFTIILCTAFSVTAVSAIAILLNKLLNLKKMLIIVIDSNKIQKMKKRVYFCAIPSAFFFFYWAVCLTALATSCELLFEVTNTSVPHVAVSDIAHYRLTALEKSNFNDKDVADLINDVNFVQRWDRQSVQAGQIVLFFVAITGLAILMLTTISGQNILR